MPRTLQSLREAKGKSLVALEEVYQCHNFKDITKCFALINYEVMDNISGLSKDVSKIKTKLGELEEKQGNIRCDLDTTKSNLKADIE